MTDPTQALQALLQPPGLKVSLFPANSRYQGIPISNWTRPDGSQVAYVQRRFVPPPQQYVQLLQHSVLQIPS